VKTQLENQFEGGRGVAGDIGVDTIQSPKAKAKWFGLRKNKKRYGFGMPQPVRVLRKIMNRKKKRQDRWGKPVDRGIMAQVPELCLAIRTRKSSASTKDFKTLFT